MLSTQTSMLRMLAPVFSLTIAHLIDDGAADGGDVHAVLHNDVQLDGNVPFFVGNDAHALAHCLAAQQVDEPVGHRAVGHALDAKAARGRGAGDIRQGSVGNADFALFGL